MRAHLRLNYIIRNLQLAFLLDGFGGDEESEDEGESSDRPKPSSVYIGLILPVAEQTVNGGRRTWWEMEPRTVADNAEGPDSSHLCSQCRLSRRKNVLGWFAFGAVSEPVSRQDYLFRTCFGRRMALRFAILSVSMVICFAAAAADFPKELSPKEEIERIRELARMIRQTESPSELTVESLLQWLQGRFPGPATRKTRQQSPSREYLPALPSNNGLSKPRPFQKPQQTQRPFPSQGNYPQASDQTGFDAFSPGPTSNQPQFDYQRPNAPQDDVPSQRPTDSSTSFPSYSPPPATQEQETETHNEVGQFGPEENGHPPHIHSLNVQCAKDMMTITIEFDRVFDGVIYSKGFYNMERCRYVKPNSGQQRYTFTVSLDSCGTQFIDEFNQGGQAYLENVLVVQNEPGIQEVWDTVRNVRCMWDGSIRQDLSVSLVIGMLAQEVVTFGTGTARLGIQVGKGPFAPPANGLVKIGELMTLVVYVEGDANLDVIVRQCQARDSAGENSIQLFDERGCVLKPKLFGAFQKTRETGNTGASVIAYAYFSAFKFPDEMDLIIECSVELCKSACDICPEQSNLEPIRKRRDVSYNETIENLPNRVSGRIRVVAPDDLKELNLRESASLTETDEICMSTPSFLLSSLLILTLLLVSSITSASMWLKLQKLSESKC